MSQPTDHLSTPRYIGAVRFGFFLNGDPWPAWAWEDHRLYGMVCCDGNNERIDPLTVQSTEA